MYLQDFNSRLSSNAKKRKPLALTLKVYLIYFALLVLVPVQSAFPLNWVSALFFGITIIFALAGMKAAAMGVKHSNRRALYYVDFELLSKIIILISTVGVALALVDRFLIRGVGITHDALEARAAIESAGSGVVGMFAAFLSCFSAFGVISVWLVESSCNKKNKILSLVAYINIGLYLYLSVMLGSRSLLLVIFVSHVSAKLLMTNKLNKSQFRIFAGIVIVAGILVLTAFVLIFQSRLSIMGLSSMESIQVSAYAYTLMPTGAVLDFISGNEFLEGFGAAAYSLILYAYHGMFEFFYLFNNLNSNHTYGTVTFWLPLKIFETVFGSVARLDLESLSNYRSGVFTTFVGPLFLDFSIFAPFASFLIFYLISLPNKFVIQKRSQWVFFVIIAEAIIIFSPVMSLLQSGVGMYLIVAAACIGVFAPKKKSNA